MDILIPYIQSPHNELRYALRSLERFQPQSRVLLVGEIPDFYKGDGVYYREQSLTKQLDVRNKIFKANGAVSSDFILTYDDVYQLAEGPAVNTHCGLLKDINLSNYGTWFTACIQNTMKVYPDGYYYGNHQPVIINKFLFSEAMQLDWRKDYLIKSIYGNYAAIGGDYAPDCKIKHGTDVREFIKGRQYFSSGANITWECLEILKELYPDKSRYER